MRMNVHTREPGKSNVSTASSTSFVIDDDWLRSNNNHIDKINSYLDWWLATSMYDSIDNLLIYCSNENSREILLKIIHEQWNKLCHEIFDGPITEMKNQRTNSKQ